MPGLRDDDWRCPYCSHWNRQGRSICRECGQALPSLRRVTRLELRERRSARIIEHQLRKHGLVRPCQTSRLE